MKCNCVYLTGLGYCINRFSRLCLYFYCQDIVQYELVPGTTFTKDQDHATYGIEYLSYEEALNKKKRNTVAIPTEQIHRPDRDAMWRFREMAKDVGKKIPIKPVDVGLGKDAAKFFGSLGNSKSKYTFDCLDKHRILSLSVDSPQECLAQVRLDTYLKVVSTI